jgi:tripartite-type tricarboxylate transporter receptor subunit TctC
MEGQLVQQAQQLAQLLQADAQRTAGQQRMVDDMMASFKREYQEANLARDRERQAAELAVERERADWRLEMEQMVMELAVLGKDNVAQFAPIALVSAAPYVVAVNPKLGAKTMRELISKAKAQPGKLTYGSSGEGSASHLTVELFQQAAGIEMLHVPYKGAAPAIADLLGGQVQMSFQTALSAIPHLKSGKLNVIAVASKKRMAALPNVPTMAEAGFADFEVSSWNGLFAPAKTPTHIVNALYNATIKALQTQDIKEKMEAQGAEPVGSSPDEFKAFVKAEIDKWEQVIIKSGARFD